MRLYWPIDAGHAADQRDFLLDTGRKHPCGPAVRVRALTGCHLRCTFCDTEYAFKEGETRSIDSIVEEVCSHPCDFVEVTGGEPLYRRVCTI